MSQHNTNDDNIQHGIDDNAQNDDKKGAALGGVGGAVAGGVAGSVAGPVGTVVGAVVGGLGGAAASGAAVHEVDKHDNDNTVTGLGHGATRDLGDQAHDAKNAAEAKVHDATHNH